MEKEPKIKSKKEKESIVFKPEFQEFIERREIDPEDFEMIEKLASFSKDFIIEFHNFFNLLKERSMPELKRLAKNTDDKEKKDFYETVLSFVEKYDWSAAYNLIRILEKQEEESE